MSFEFFRLCLIYIFKQVYLSRASTSRILINKAFIIKNCVIWSSIKDIVKNYKIIQIDKLLKFYYERNDIRLRNKL